MYDSAREEFEQLERLREVSYVAAVKIILQAWHCSCVLASDGPIWAQCQPLTGKT